MSASVQNASDEFKGPSPSSPRGSPQATKLDPKIWRCIYPAYIDSTKSVNGGRKIAIEFCVPNPQVHEMAIIARSLNLPVEIEDKRLPRDPFSKGRIRVRLLDAFGKPYSDALATPLMAMKQIALGMKKAREQQKAAQEAAEKKAAQTAVSPAQQKGKRRS